MSPSEYLESLQASAAESQTRIPAKVWKKVLAAAEAAHAAGENMERAAWAVLTAWFDR